MSGQALGRRPRHSALSPRLRKNFGEASKFRISLRGERFSRTSTSRQRISYWARIIPSSLRFWSNGNSHHAVQPRRLRAGATAANPRVGSAEATSRRRRGEKGLMGASGEWLRATIASRGLRRANNRLPQAGSSCNMAGDIGPSAIGRFWLRHEDIAF